MTGLGIAGLASGEQPEGTADEAFVRTPLCDLLGIRHPIVQSGMGRVAGPELAAEVSRAGGLGVLAGLGLTGDELRPQIRKLRELTDRPFGVNLWLHEEILPPADSSQIPEETLLRIQKELNRFRERLGLPPRFDRPPSFPDVVDSAFEAVLDERVPVWSVGLGDPGRERVRRCRERGVRVMAMVATVEDARQVASSGADVIVAQGGEAGGHRSTWKRPLSREHANIGSIALVPQIVDAVDAPVVAAGGIADGRGLVAALALGAAGVLMGTRFVATRESTAPDVWKSALLGASSDRTTVTEALTGLPARALRNAFTEEYAASNAPVLPSLLQAQAAGDIYAAAAARGDAEHFPLFAGQSVGFLRDLPGAADVVRQIVREARAVMASLADRASGAKPLP
jgi:nitronate monooxygenase